MSNVAANAQTIVWWAMFVWKATLSDSGFARKVRFETTKVHFVVKTGASWDQEAFPPVSDHAR